MTLANKDYKERKDMVKKHDNFEQKTDKDAVDAVVKEEEGKAKQKNRNPEDVLASKSNEDNFKNDNSEEENKNINVKEAEFNNYKAKIEELTDTAQRVMADFENYKKRVEKDKEQNCRYSSAEVISKLLPVVDTFDNALKNGCEKESKGIALIRSQLMAILEKEGMRPIICIGKKYDPYHHDILMQEDSDKEEGIIIEELQKGYMFKDKVLRHSMVKVSKKKEVNNNNLKAE